MIFKSYLFLKINTREGKTEVYSCGYAKQSLLWYFCFLVIALFSLHTTVKLLLPHPVWLLTGPLLRLALENQELCKSPDLSENEMLSNNQLPQWLISMERRGSQGEHTFSLLQTHCVSPPSAVPQPSCFQVQTHVLGRLPNPLYREEVLARAQEALNPVLGGCVLFQLALPEPSKKGWVMADDGKF